MTTLLDEPATTSTTTHAQRLQAAMAAVRVAFMWLGTRKTLTPEQKSEAAEPFGAARDFLSAGKKLLDTSHPAFKAVTAVRGRVIQYWKSISLPYPEPGIRLIRQSDIGAFDVQLTSLKDELVSAVASLNCEYSALKAAARRRLGRLYNAADYPLSLESLFGVAWDYPSVQPPPYLQQLSPELYRQECERVRSRFEEAVRLAEQAFIDEFARLVSHLTERLSGGEEGQARIFRDSVVENLHEFFGRFRTLNIGSHEQLNQLVDEAQGIVRGVRPQALRDSGSLRQHVATQLSAVQAGLDGLLVDRPRRRILPRQLQHEQARRPFMMQLVVAPDGTARCIYGEEIDLSALGQVAISRASHVEPAGDGMWQADLSPVNGPLLGPFLRRSDALAAELQWLTGHWLSPQV